MYTALCLTYWSCLDAAGQRPKLHKEPVVVVVAGCGQDQDRVVEKHCCRHLRLRKKDPGDHTVYCLTHLSCSGVEGLVAEP